MFDRSYTVSKKKKKDIIGELGEQIHIAYVLGPLPMNPYAQRVSIYIYTYIVYIYIYIYLDMYVLCMSECDVLSKRKAAHAVKKNER